MSDHEIRESVQKPGYAECEIFIDENKLMYVTHEKQPYPLGKVQFENGFYHFVPGENVAFIEEALIAIAKILSRVSEMPSDEEIDGLFNDK